MTSNSTLTFEFQIILSQDLSSVPVKALIMKVSDGKLLISCDEKKNWQNMLQKQQIFFALFKKEVFQE